MRGVAPKNRLSDYPYLVSPKIDGIRAIVMDGVVLSKTLKPIRNERIQRDFSHLEGLDGELVVGDAFGDGVYDRTRRVVMSARHTSQATFHVFDRWDQPEATARMRIQSVRMLRHEVPDNVVICQHWIVETADDLRRVETTVLAQGYEGVMLRKFNAPYKYGTATEREGYLLKLKRFHDSEAEILSVTEQQTNTNKRVMTNVGTTIRSSSRKGKIPAGTLGSFHVRDCYTGVEFDVGCGPGLTHRLRKILWGRRESLPGTYIRYSFQKCGTTNAPRLPQWRGFRDAMDMADLPEE